MPSVNKPLQYKIVGKIFTGLPYKLLSSFAIISDVYKSFIRNKATFTKYCHTQWISKLPGLSKAVFGKFHRSGGHSKHICLLDRINFHMSQAWQIVLIFNTALPELLLASFYDTTLGANDLDCAH